MLSKIDSASLHGIEGRRVEVEVNVGEPGEPNVVIVGLPTSGVKESKDRVWAALDNSSYGLPKRKTTVNLAPADLRKDGPAFDLPIAIALLRATGQLLRDSFDEFLVAGELGLSGEVRPIRGGLAIAHCAKALGKRTLLLPPKTAEEAALIKGIDVFKIHSLEEACSFLEGKIQLSPQASRLHCSQENPPDFDFSEVKGQYAVRRAIEVAVAGNHNLLMIGPPGSGKSMLAKRISTIMPKLSENEYLDILRIYSATGKTLTEDGLIPQRPFRSPHHTISDVGLIGGGSVPGPGEISLAHQGVLFLDELPEFKRSALEVLRQPLEDGEVTISRSAGQLTLPARCMLVAAMNPTPCGGTPGKITSTSTQIMRYRSRLSGPLLDRIDIHIEAPALSLDELRKSKTGESSKSIRDRIEFAREIQRKRFKKFPFEVNSAMPPKALREFCHLSEQQGDILQQAMEKLSLSARAYDRILKVSRTIADLESHENIATSHLLEAIQYRSLDRNRPI